MSEFKPHFKTLVQVFHYSAEHFAQRPLFGVKREGTWHWSTYQDFVDQTLAIHAALSGLGVRAGDRVAVISNNRPEWAIAGFATYGLGGVYVPMYESQSDEDWLYILRDSQSKVLFVPNATIAQRIRAMRGSLPDLLHVVVFDESAEATEHSFATMLRATPSPALTDPGETSLACFIYTSGTTGNPKGVKLSHANLAYNVSAMNLHFPMSPEDRSLSFLPWAHCFGQTVELYGLISMGASLGIAEAVDMIVANLAEVKPTILFSVPRIFNRIYERLHKTMEQEGGIKKKLFEAGLANASRRRQLVDRGTRDLLVEIKHHFFDRIVFSKVRERFGGKLRYAFSGGAAISKEVAEFIDNLGIMVYEGYGLTETSPIATMNCPGARKIGSVGKPIKGVTIELDQAETETPGEGEVVIYGHNVMQGYHGLPQENARVLVEKNGKRGFRSGDLGRIDADGFLYITGRCKEQYKLLNGKYVVPTPLEEQLKLSPYIVNAMVYGANQEFNVAVLIPDFETLRDWAKRERIDATNEELVQDARVKELMERQIREYSHEFKNYEKIHAFYLGVEDFTTQNGLLTPTMKLKRNKVYDKYSPAIAALYANAATSQNC